MATGHLPKWSHSSSDGKESLGNFSKGERASRRTKHHNMMPSLICSKHFDLENKKVITAENTKWFQTYI